MSRKKLTDLFLTFMKIGLFTFGGGYAMISLIEDICVEKKKWMSHDDLMNLAVIAESTPGPIGINCATYAGYKVAGLTGAACATVAVVIPSFLIISIIASFLDHVIQLPLITGALKGIQVAVGFLILNAGLKMLQKLKKTPLSCAIVAISALVMLLVDLLALNISTISLMLTSAVISLWVTQRPGKEKAA